MVTKKEHQIQTIVIMAGGEIVIHTPDCLACLNEQEPEEIDWQVDVSLSDS